MKGLSFAIALNTLQGMNDGSMSRPSWNGKGMKVKIQYPTKESKMTHPYMYMVKEDGTTVPWVPSTGDLFAEDWEVFAGENTEIYEYEMEVESDVR